MLTNEQLVQYADFEVLMRAARDMHASMKAEVDGEFAARYAETGDKGRDALEDGVKTASLTWVPPTAGRRALAVDDQRAFYAWCEANGCLRPDEGAALEHMAATGEVPDGCEAVEKPGRRGYVKVTPTRERAAQVTARATWLLKGGGA